MALSFHEAAGVPSVLATSTMKFERSIVERDCALAGAFCAPLISSTNSSSLVTVGRMEAVFRRPSPLPSPSASAVQLSLHETAMVASAAYAIYDNMLVFIIICFFSSLGDIKFSRSKKYRQSAAGCP
jgi:hypothetical protein